MKKKERKKKLERGKKNKETFFSFLFPFLNAPEVKQMDLVERTELNRVEQMRRRRKSAFSNERRRHQRVNESTLKKFTRKNRILIIIIIITIIMWWWWWWWSD